MSIMSFLNNVKTGAKTHAPLIFAFGGLAAAAATVVFAVKEVPKVKLAMEDKVIEKENAIRAKLPEEQRGIELNVHLTTAERIALIFKCTWPAIVAACASIGCTIMSQVVSGRRIRAARTAADISERALEEYVINSAKKLGKTKTQEVEEEIAKQAIEKHPAKTDASGNIIASGRGDVLIYDAMMEKYFWSSIDKINRAVNEVNAQILEGEFVTINEFYDEIGGDIKHCALGDDLGFGAGIDSSGKSAFIRQTYIAKINEDNEVYIVLNYICKDRRTYKVYHPREEY